MRQPVPRVSFLSPVSIRPSVSGGLALDDGPIDLLDLPAGEQRAEPPQRLRMPAEHQAAAGVAVEPMGERRRVRQAEAQLIEAAFEIRTAAGAGMHRNPRRLVDDQDQPVAIKDAIGKLPLSSRPSPR